MPWQVYVLRSERDGKLYTGITSGDLEGRLARHNAGRVRSTKGRGPFVVVYREAVADRRAARHREECLKSGWGRESLQRQFGRPGVAEPASGEQARRGG